MSWTTLALPAILIAALVPIGVVLALHDAEAKPSGGSDVLQVQTAGTGFASGDTVRIWLRNTGDEAIEGSPRILVMRPEGGIQQIFAFGQFQLRLDPDEAVWVDWATQPGIRGCDYGHARGATDGESAGSMPCRLDDTMAPAGIACYNCVPNPGLVGEFVLVGTFGAHADAHVVTLRP